MLTALRKPEFNAQCPHDGSASPVTPAPGDLMPKFLQVSGTHAVNTHTRRKTLIKFKK